MSTKMLEFPFTLTDEEKLEASNQLVKANKDNMEARAKTQDLRIRAKKDMKDSQDRIEKYSTMLGSGVELREVECEVTEADGIETIMRTDTKEIVKKEPV